MKVHIEVHLRIDGIGHLQRGPFDVNPVEFAENPDMAATKIAYDFIQEIKSQTGYRETKIEKVIYDGEHNITKLVRNYEPYIDDSILPF